MKSDGHLYLNSSNTGNTDSYDLRFGANSDWSLERYGTGLSFNKPGGTNSGNNNILYMNDNLNVGIGTASPNQRLEVNGNIRAVGLQLFGPGGEFDDVIFDYSNSWGSPCLYPVENLQMEIGKATNRVNTVNTYQLFYQYGLWKYSDRRLKENIREENNTMEKLSLLSCVSYDITDSVKQEIPAANKEQQDARQFGFIAQDVQTVYPELVSTDERGYLAVNYTGLVPLMLSAIKELSARIDGLSDSLVLLSTGLADARAEQDACCQANSETSLKSGGDDGATAGATTTTSSTTTTSTSSTDTTTVDGQTPASLYQNAPNPFGAETTIGMYLPATVQQATLRVYDLTGKQLKALDVAGRGNTSVPIDGSELTPGMYHYALLADGQLVDTKTMIVID